MPIPSTSQQIQAITASARHLRELTGRTLPALDADLYLRPVPDGCTVLSVNPSRRPQQGLMRRWGPRVNFEAWRELRNESFAERDNQPTRVTPEKAMQSLLIRDAITNQGWMKLLTAACPEQPRLRFLADELAFRASDGEKTVCDVVAVRWQDDLGTLIVIELKSARHLRRLTEQVCKMATLIAGNLEDFRLLAEASWGVPVQLTPKVERWIIWPSSAAERRGDLDPKVNKCRADGVRLVTYDGAPGDGLNIRAASQIGD